MWRRGGAAYRTGHCLNDSGVLALVSIHQTHIWYQLVCLEERYPLPLYNVHPHQRPVLSTHPCTIRNIYYKSKRIYHTHSIFFAPLPGFSTEGSSVIDGKLCEQAEIKLAKGLVDKRRVFNCPGLDTPQSLLDCGTRRGLLARNSRFGHPNDGYMMDLTDYSNVIGEVNIYHIWVCLEKPHKH